MQITQWKKRVFLVKGKDGTPFDQNINRAELDSAIENAQHIYKHDKTTTVAAITIDQQTYILKRYNARNWWHHIKRAFRETRAHRCWRMSTKFEQVGLNVSSPVLMFESRIGPIRTTSYFMNRLLEGEELLQCLPEFDAAQQQQVLSAMQSVFEIMKKHKISHGDCKASNLIWNNQQLFFIDLDAAEQHSNSLTWAKAHNKDRRRFFKNWRDNPELLKLFEDL